MKAQELYDTLGNKSAGTDEVRIIDTVSGYTYKIDELAREEIKDASDILWIKISEA